jgi:hypothetical protein
MLVCVFGRWCVVLCRVCACGEQSGVCPEGQAAGVFDVVSVAGWSPFLPRWQCHVWWGAESNVVHFLCRQK